MSAFILLTFFLFLLSGCRKEEVNLAGFQGTWVEVMDSSDTIIVNDETLLTLNRGNEISPAGHLLPKSGSGMYTYQINDTQITLNNMLSSCICPNHYSFKLEENKFTIGNFYALTGQAVLTFRRIK